METTSESIPKHCIICAKVNDCKQKVHMTAKTEPVEGFASFALADYVCGDCVQNSENVEPLDNPEVDSPIHCCLCSIPLECRLTKDGVEYVKEALDGDGGCCQELWRELFSDYL